MNLDCVGGDDARILSPFEQPSPFVGVHLDGRKWTGTKGEVVQARETADATRAWVVVVGWRKGKRETGGVGRAGAKGERLGGRKDCAS